ncbi:MAG: hypothetical protein RLZZ628_2154, partial [Bacteroidota bacterium]
MSNQYDHWGFYNGRQPYNAPNTTNQLTMTGVNRTPNETFMKKGILTKITYPTGGYTTFNFEANRIKVGNEHQIVGGLRIRQVISNEGSDPAKNTITNYGYSNERDAFSSGVLMVTPKYSDTLTMFLKNDPNRAFNTVRLDYSYLSISNAPIVPLSDYNGYHVGYSRVSEEKVGSGKSIYEFYQEHAAGLDSFVYGQYPRIASPPQVKTGLLSALNLMDTLGSVRSQSTNDINVNYISNDYAYRPRITFPEDTSIQAQIIFISQYPLVKPSFIRTPKQTYIKDGVSTVTENEYGHSEFSLPTKTKVTNSDNAISELEYKYPIDFVVPSSPTVVNPYNWLVTYNVLTPIEIYRKTNGLIVEGPKIEYVTGLYDSPFLNLRWATPMPYKSYMWKRGINSGWLQTGEIKEYSTDGALKRFKATGSTVELEYTWNNGVLTQKKFGTLVSNFKYLNNNNSRLLEWIIDENGLKTKFSYDGLQRLKKIENRMNDGGTDVQATTEYAYQYKDANNPYNFLRTTNTYANVATPLVSEAYMDGLGRPIGGVKLYYTPDSLHLKSVVTYDALGRQDKAYQPFQNSLSGYPDSYPFSIVPFTQTEYEASPLSRPLKQINADKTSILTNYGTDTLKEVRKFVVTNGVCSGASFYDANTLFKTTMTDENGKQTMLFKDKLGRTILTRKFLKTGTVLDTVDTYNVYDNVGQLVAVLPPGTVNANGMVNDSLTFQYKYDDKGRLQEKKIPGSGVQKFYYDARNLLVLMQDSSMRAANPQKHLATQYDELGRVIKTGFATVNPTSGADFTLTDSQITDTLTKTVYYPNKSWVKHQGAKVLKNAGTNTTTDFLWSYVERRDACNYTGNPAWTGKQHLMSASVSKNPILDSDVEGVDWSITGLTGAGQPTMTLRYLFSEYGVRQVRSWENYSYDNGMRMTDHRYFYTVDGSSLSAPTFTLNNMVYNYKDQLIEKNIGYQLVNGVNRALQSIDYSYNTRGWLTDINGARTREDSKTKISPTILEPDQPILTPTTRGSSKIILNLAISPFVGTAIGQSEYLPPVADNNVDLFSQSIMYDDPETQTGAAPQYNGNISSTTWQVAGRTKQSYGFTYDDLNRLTNANFFDVTETYTPSPKQTYPPGNWSSTFSTDNKFQEQLTYDLRGNIQTLKRNGMNLGGWAEGKFVAGNYGLIDNLKYSYVGGNQLKSITESSLLDRGFKTNPAVTSDQYGYDGNGNLIYDKNKYITSIEYNYLNLPMKIVISKPNDALNSGSIELVYDASGAKLKKSLKDNAGVVKETWDYVNGVEYKNRILQRVPHSEGAV